MHANKPYVSRSNHLDSLFFRLDTHTLQPITSHPLTPNIFQCSAYFCGGHIDMHSLFFSLDTHSLEIVCFSHCPSALHTNTPPHHIHPLLSPHAASVGVLFTTTLTLYASHIVLPPSTPHPSHHHHPHSSPYSGYICGEGGAH